MLNFCEKLNDPREKVKQEFILDFENWTIILMNFVDDFRYYKDPEMVKEPFDLDNERVELIRYEPVQSLGHHYLELYKVHTDCKKN